jgi:transcriptional regulator with XRE-family HTH domain
MLFRTALGEVLREARLTKGLNLRDVSGGGFIALGYLSEIERGQKEISSEPLDNVAKALGIPTHEILMRTAMLMALDGQTIPDTAEDLVDNFVSIRIAHTN